MNNNYYRLDIHNAICYTHSGPGTTIYEKAQAQIAKGRDIKIITFDELKRMISENVVVEKQEPEIVPQYVFPANEEGYPGQCS